jgi:hypothetical protein
MAQRHKVGRHLKLDCINKQAVCKIRRRSQIKPNRSKKAVGLAVIARKTTTIVTCL